MKRMSLVLLLGYAAIAYGETQLTVYNQNFAVVKEQRLLKLEKGENELRVTDITAHLEPDSVVLRDMKDADAIKILEQNYESDPLSEGLLLRKSEGNAFDIVGERRQTNFKIDHNGNWMDESFEIKVRNHKKDEVEVRVTEHLYRWITWDITAKSMVFSKKDARTIEFRGKIPADGEAVITYTVH